MDQVDRGSRMRLGEETVRQRLARADRDRDRRYSALDGRADDDHVARYVLVVIIAIFVITAIVVAVAAGSVRLDGEPAAQEGAHVGTPTLEVTRVRPPVWFTLAKPSSEAVAP